MIPLEKVKKIIDSYQTLETELSSSNLDKKNFVKKSKEYSSIGEIIDQARGYLGIEKEKILFPFINKITSLKPPASLFDIFIISNDHFFFRQTFSYILKRSATKRVASNPPVPALISRIAFFESASSLGKR